MTENDDIALFQIGIEAQFNNVAALWYSDCISVIASSPVNKFSETEEQEVIEILSGFRNADDINSIESANKSNSTGNATTLKEVIDTDEPVVFYFLNFSYVSDYTILHEDASIDSICKILVFDNGKVSSITPIDEFNNGNNMELGNLLNISDDEIIEKTSDWNKYILTGETNTTGTALIQEEFWYEVGNGYMGYELYIPVSIEINGNYYAGLYESGGSWIQLFVTPCEQGTTFSFDNVGFLTVRFKIFVNIFHQMMTKTCKYKEFFLKFVTDFEKILCLWNFSFLSQKCTL